MKVADYNHVILYAKGWYQHNNIIEDLKSIFAKRSSLAVENMSDGNVWENMVRVLMKYADSHQVSTVLDELFKPIADECPGMALKFFEDTCPLKRAIRRIMTVLAQLPVEDNEGNLTINLGRPDPNILSLGDEDALERWDAMNETPEVKDEG